MSYDLRIGVKVEGIDKYIVVAIPEHDCPTYNLGEMFRACMNWNYEQGKYYKCSEVFDNITHGICELSYHPEKYEKYNSPNGWGDVEDARRTLISLRECITEKAEDIPIKHLYLSW